jgi:hypothetical protein
MSEWIEYKSALIDSTLTAVVTDILFLCGPDVKNDAKTYGQAERQGCKKKEQLTQHTRPSYDKNEWTPNFKF